MKYLIPLLCLLWFASCEKVSGPDNIVNEEGSPFLFEEILLLVELKNSDSSNILVAKIDSAELFVNGKFWSVSPSDIIDTTLITNKYLDGSTFVTNSHVDYLIRSKQQFATPSFDYAGDYARYINSFYNLRPGEYACFVRSLSFTLNNGDSYKVFPQKYLLFEVKENTQSAFVGKISITIPEL